MYFTSLEFLYLVLPFSVLISLFLNKITKKVFLLLVSIFFYAYGDKSKVLILIASIVINYVLGLTIEKSKGKTFARILFTITGVTFNVGLLFYYKYLSVMMAALNSLLSINFTLKEIVQPIGISFFTFRSISYLLDISWGTVKADRNFTNVALYISFFPQLLMGPISKYNEFVSQYEGLRFDKDMFLDGCQRIIIGLGKKLIIANNLAPFVDEIFSLPIESRSVVLSWVGIIAYIIQLYYDFSGYSDMAIGVGQMYGFKTPENFNYPFISTSITEYWSRWHITLGTWLKNYIYFPVFRLAQKKENSIVLCDCLALLCVWVIAGIWHGAGFNYLLYGIYYFTFIELERVIEQYRKRRRKKLHLKKKKKSTKEKVLSHVYFFIVLVFGQLLFRTGTINDFVGYVKTLFGGSHILIDTKTMFYLDKLKVLLPIGILFAFPISTIRDLIIKKWNKLEILFIAIKPLAYGFVLALSLAYAMSGTYQSFIYFKF